MLWSVPLFLLVGLMAMPAGAAEAGATWFGIYRNEQKIGWHHETVVTAGDAITQTSHTAIKLAMGPMTIRTTIDGELVCDTAYQPRTFAYRLAGDMLDLSVAGEVRGDSLTVRMTSAGTTTEKQFSAREVTLPQLADLMLRGMELKVGDSFAFQVFEPTAQASGELRISVDREELLPVGSARQTVRVLKLSFAGIETETWLDAAGEPLLITMPMGMTFRREAPELAQADQAGEPLDLLTSAAITPIRPIKNPRRLFAARYRLAGTPLDGLTLTGAGQGFADAVVRIDRLQELPAASPAGEVQPPDAFCDYNQKDVAELAQRLPAGTRDARLLPRDYVQADLGWIKENITPRLTLSLPRASQVLAMRQGDCNEMAVLLCALLRAQGIPAQVVAGVVYVDGKFYYHAWVEADIGGLQAIDPAFNQESADATHIKLVAGDVLAQARIIPVIGKLQIEPLPAEGE